MLSRTIACAALATSACLSSVMVSNSLKKACATRFAPCGARDRFSVAVLAKPNSSSLFQVFDRVRFRTPDIRPPARRPDPFNAAARPEPK